MLTVEVDGGVVDVTVGMDEEVRGLLVVFIDTTPRRPVRATVDGRAITLAKRA